MPVACSFDILNVWWAAGAPGTDGTDGSDGSDGTNGTNGTNGIDGTSVTFVDYFSGTTYAGAATGCPNGGAVYAAGNPAVNAYVCNGTNGTNGTNGIDGTGATNPDPPCFDNTNRYVNCGNGTVTDTVTGLIWLQTADCFLTMTYSAANQAAAGLAAGQCGLTDGSSAGDWRLPTKAEWEATVARGVALGCTSPADQNPPPLTNNAGTNCINRGTSGTWFTGWGTTQSFWSSTAVEVFPHQGWSVSFDNGAVGGADKANSFLRVWAVRGGRR